MEEAIKTQYRLIEERFVKIAWTHKIQEVQGNLYLKKLQCQKKTMAVVNALTTTSAIATVLSNFDIEWLMPVITAALAVLSSYFTFRYKDGTLESLAKANKLYAAKCRTLRNAYESLLADVMSCRITNLDEIAEARKGLEDAENELFCGAVAPHTTEDAVKIASKALKQDRESQTEEDEIRSIVPKTLQVI